MRRDQGLCPDHLAESSDMAQTAMPLTRQSTLWSLDPDDPRGPVEFPDDAMTGDDAGALLIWCGAAALCIAETLQPGFRVRPAS